LHGQEEFGWQSEISYYYFPIFYQAGYRPNTSGSIQTTTAASNEITEKVIVGRRGVMAACDSLIRNATSFDNADPPELE